KILVAGASFLGSSGTGNDFAVVRYNPDGSLDTTFDGDGKLTTDFGAAFNNDVASAITVQPDGKILVAGSGSSFSASNSDFAVARYNPDGSLDTSFAGVGKFTFGLGGFNDFASDVVLQPDGKILIAGTTFIDSGSHSDFAVVRLNSDGSFDTTFDGDGRLITNLGLFDQVASLALQPDGKILVAGGTSTGAGFDFALVRYNSNGSLDTTFDGDGKLTTN